MASLNLTAISGDGLRAHEFAVIVHSVLVGIRCFHEAALLGHHFGANERVALVTKDAEVVHHPLSALREDGLAIATENDGSVEPSFRTILPVSNSDR